ncbi:MULTISPECIES: ACR3 family arsenite efflux transporter [unclassified Marinitoga]|uniref:ACR3 family arsenite efflux transporter n=1 Tax=unclassified Marinitoga TaxID=2640159 RepID=UPI0006418849|nr:MULTISPECIES: ACR3 family arsenite efflux transporter [unclassified Marinitoga]KLO22224.1 arsenic transporter [Marinitoga sp. 1155]NUV00169.1 arsenic transporter [Marinitoga sp. 1154]
MKKKITIFEKYLSLWVIICIIFGVFIGNFFPLFPKILSKLEYANVSIPVAILIWLMIFPMMLKIDFSSIKNVRKNPKGIIITLIINWVIKPFTMYFFAWVFFKYIFAAFISPELAAEYIAGAVLLGAAPCTAMVFVWSYLSDGDPAYTLVQVAINDIIILFAFAPIVSFLLKVGNVNVPFNTLILSVVFFVLFPLIIAVLTRKHLIKKRGLEWFNKIFLKEISIISPIGLLITLIILFSFQGKIILNNYFHILLISIPLIIQTFFIFSIGYFWAYKWNLSHKIAAPAAMIGASNFFELAVAVAISLFGLESGAVLTTVVGVLVEVPVMLTLVNIANKTKNKFIQEV